MKSSNTGKEMQLRFITVTYNLEGDDRADR